MLRYGQIQNIVQLNRMVEIQDFLVAIVGATDEVQEDLDDPEEKLTGRRVGRSRILINRI